MQVRFRDLAPVLLPVALIALAPLGCDDTDESSVGFTELSVSEAKQLVDSTPGLVIIDVSPYWADGHLPGAVSHPVGDGSLAKAIPTLDKSKAYLVYCHGDAPSIQGAQALVDAGFSPVYRLKGNFQAWQDAGYPIEK